MPSSSVASQPASHSSAGSHGSRRAKSHQYRTLSCTSQVDESLFGEANHVKDRQAMMKERHVNCYNTGEDVEIEVTAARRSADKPQVKGRRGPGDKKETIQVISKDLIRKLVVPEEDPSGKSIVLTFSDFLRLKGKSQVLTPEEERTEKERVTEAKEAARQAVQERKAFLKEMDMKRIKNEKLTDLEEEAREKAQHLLQKAIEQRQDQEDEIKHLNELILNAKIQAIRDAQILEKRVIAGEMSEEERRLDVMMEVDRVNSIKIQEEIDKRRKEEEMIGASQIMKQIMENEQERLIELEKKDQENIAAQKYIAKLMEEEIEKRAVHKTKQELHRLELNKANADIMERKKKDGEIDRLIDLKVLEHQRQKAEREASYEAEQERIRVEKEMEISRLRAQQERAKDEQEERDALRAKRASEQAERDWRKKETAEAAKKVATEQELLLARAAQTEQKEHFLAVQAARDRFEFERVLKAQKELIEKDRREEETQVAKRSIYSDEVRRQIREKEQQKIAERNAFFEEGVRMEEEARLRRLRLEEAKARKMKELRSAGIPEKYLMQVERKINQPQQA